MSDHYDTLGVAPNATPREIEDAYREICEKFHPEKHEDNALRELAEEKLRQAEVAYSTLRDTRLRARYDRELGIRGEQASSGQINRKGFFGGIGAQILQSLFIRVLWVGFGYLYARLVKFNLKIILFTLAALALIWAFRKYRRS